MGSISKYFRAFGLTVTAIAGVVAVALAQPPQIEVSLFPPEGLIGDRFTLEVMVEKDVVQVVEFPAFDGMLTDKIEVVHDYPADTLETDGRRQTISKKYLLTCFDAGVYTLSSFPVLYVDKNITDTLYVEKSVKMTVNTFPVDTLRNTIYDIKVPEAAPLMWAEFMGYVVAAFVLGCTVAAIVILLMQRRRRRKGIVEEAVAAEPPHERAIRELEVLHNQKLWQSNRHKTYYTKLTDILRTYLQGRYGIGAMEMTTEEIMSAVSGYDLPEKNSRDLSDTLKAADLVKFAKFVPGADDNEHYYYSAYYFVEDTKVMPEETIELEASETEHEA